MSPALLEQLKSDISNVYVKKATKEILDSHFALQIQTVENPNDEDENETCNYNSFERLGMMKQHEMMTKYHEELDELEKQDL